MEYDCKWILYEECHNDVQQIGVKTHSHEKLYLKWERWGTGMGFHWRDYLDTEHSTLISNLSNTSLAEACVGK